VDGGESELRLWFLFFMFCGGYQAGSVDRKGGSVFLWYQAGSVDRKDGSVFLWYQVGSKDRKGGNVFLWYQAPVLGK
jgi:hypothetical protein